MNIKRESAMGSQRLTGKLSIIAAHCWLIAFLDFTSARSRGDDIYNWQTGPWGVCWSKDGCGGGSEERTVWCGDSLGRPVPKHLCRDDEMPGASRPCFTACQGIWKTGMWSDCQLERGSRERQDDGLCLGVRHRNVTCLSLMDNVTPSCSEAIPPSTVSCYTVCPEDCVVGPWTSWTPCDQDCHNYKYRTRQVLVPPAHGGSPCPVLSETESCKDNCVNKKYFNEVLPVEGSTFSSFSPSTTTFNHRSSPSAKLRVGEWGKCKVPIAKAASLTSDFFRTRNSSENVDDKSFETRLEWEIRDAVSILESEALKNEKVDYLSASQLNGIKYLGSVYPQVGIQERNSSCVGLGGQKLPIRECTRNGESSRSFNVRSCIIAAECQLTHWTDWKTIIEGCVAPNGQVVKEVRERRRSALSLQKGDGTPCPHLLERHTVPEPSLQPCNSKYQWLASSWGPCMSTVGPEPEARVTCGGGVQKRQITCVAAKEHIPVEDRFCLHVEPPPRYQRCEVGCERDCIVGPWSAWGMCTPVKCDTVPTPAASGFRRRMREVVVSASPGGKECPPLEEQTSCHSAQCHQWLIGDWSECILDNQSDTCGKGHIVRNITCVDSVGAPAPTEECQVELGVVSERDACQVPCSYDCVLAPWSSWSPCSRSCADETAVGYTHRNTTILAHRGPGGRECPAPDELTQIETCREEPCSGAAWIPDEWGQCLPESDSSCGPGIQIRPVFCVEQRTGQETESYRCSGLLPPRQEKTCEISCGSKCSMTPWSNWSECITPEPCPKGNRPVTSKQTRWRRILVHPTKGNAPCGPTEEERPCAFASGYCKPSKWHTTPWSECALAPGIECGVGFRVRGVHCINGSGDMADPTQCLLGNKIIPESSQQCFVLCDKRCVLSSWSAWSPCPKSAPCLSSYSFRTRIILDGTEKHPECRDMVLRETKDCPCLKYYSEVASDWSECLLGPPIDIVKDSTLETSVKVEYDEEGDEENLKEYEDVRESVKKMEATQLEENMNLVSNDEEVIMVKTNADHVCGVGTRYRGLKCVREDKVLADPSMCGHAGIEWEPCIVECPSDCLVDQWEEWSSCNASCGAGTQSRERQVVQPSLWSGRNCPAVRQERACWGYCHNRWIAEGWSECQLSQDNECGIGEQRRTIKCVHLLSSGMEVAVEDSHCDLPNRPPDRQPCKIYCPGECVVSEWSAWTICPKGCSEITERRRTRKVIRSPSKKATDCPHLLEREPCMQDISCWTYSWHAGNWTDCIPLGRSSCGEGVRNRPVSCVRSDGTPVSEHHCARESRPAPQEKWCYVDCPIDCQVTSWTEWDDSKCSCGEKPGAMKRKRFILVNPSESGRRCPENLEETLPCPIVPCYTWERGSWSDCQLMGGKCGHGVMERRVRCIGPGGVDVSPDKCLALVHVGGHTWPYLAHALDLNTKDGCYMPCEGDCELTEWSPWSHCHRDCSRGQQGGTQTRSRAIISTGSSTPCPGPLWESRPCVAGPCLSYSWQIIHGSAACVRSDGLIVTGGCGDVPRPCVPDCTVRGAVCSPVGVCVCRPGLRPHYSESMRYRLTKCVPNFNMSLTKPLALSQAKYLPENINGWMFAMIGVGSAFVIFVIISVYLMSKSPRDESPIPLTLRRQTLHPNSSAHST